MTRLNWTDASARLFETGLDRGVLYPRTVPAVAWNGLMSIDETGADESTVYYIEGRPFLNVPQPKEYEATLKAYTYPDEFGPMMGLIEATDGMYLDSQQSEMFDLSYRTLIGNAQDGITFGYKIHLVYNATVDPQGHSYESLGSEVNPNELSWDIKAVPVPVAGFRSTAHIMIDTRHMDETKLGLLEDLLYGTDTTTVSELPTPAVILDTLAYDDTVVIVDNGDGTWTATGSYENINLLGDGDFRLNNVEATTDSDGIFYFGLTPPPPPPPPVTEIDGGTSSSSGTGSVDGGDPSSTNGGDTFDGGAP